MSYFGLDIGSYAIKFVKAEGHDSHAKIKTIGSVYNSVGQILPGDTHQFDQLATLIKNGVKEFGLLGLNCHLSLPSPQAYMSIVQMPSLTDAELSSAIKWEAEQHIPVSLSEVNFEYDVVYRPTKNSSDDSMSVFMVGVPKTVVDKYISLMESAGIELIGLEPDVISLMRTFYTPKDDKNTDSATLVCHFGALNTSFVIMDSTKLHVVHTANIGSLALTRTIEKSLGLDPSRSEEYKRTYGLQQNQLEGKVRTVLTPVFDALVSEIRKTIQFFVSQSPANNTVSRIIISGGGSNLPEMSSYLVEALSLEVVVGNPFANLSVDNKIHLPEDVASYAVAVGLATKAF